MLTEIPTVHQLTAKYTTGNGNLQPKMESNEYASTRGSHTIKTCGERKSFTITLRRCYAMMMKFIFNVAAISWMMSYRLYWLSTSLQCGRPNV